MAGEKDRRGVDEGFESGEGLVRIWRGVEEVKSIWRAFGEHLESIWREYSEG